MCPLVVGAFRVSGLGSIPLLSIRARPGPRGSAQKDCQTLYPASGWLHQDAQDHDLSLARYGVLSGGDSGISGRFEYVRKGGEGNGVEWRHRREERDRIRLEWMS